MTKTKLKRILKISFIVASICSLYFVPWKLVKAWVLPLPETIQQQTEEAINYGFEGIIVYVDQSGKPAQSYTAGWHNRDLKIPAKPNALFKIASIGKLFDAVAVTKLVHEERLSLDKTVADYLPELSSRIENSDKITLSMLIQHKSGIPNYSDSPNFWSAPKSYDECLALILDKPANFKPGKGYEYCNTNYLLINKIMDNELGYENFKYVKEKVLNPLKLNNTYASINEVNIDSLMSGYHIDHPYDLKEDDYGMIATAKDVAIFIRALNVGSLFEPAEQDIYTSIYEYEHSGWVPGYQSFATYNKEIDAVIIIFYSTTDADLIMWNLSEIINKRIVGILKKQKG